MTSVTVICRLANGKQVYGTNMWCVEVGEVRTQEATFAVRFEGDSVSEAPIHDERDASAAHAHD